MLSVDEKLSSKGIVAQEPKDELEPYIITMQICYELEWTIINHNYKFPEKPLLGSELERYVNYKFKEDSTGIKLGKYLFYTKILDDHKKVIVIY